MAWQCTCLVWAATRLYGHHVAASAFVAGLRDVDAAQGRLSSAANLALERAHAGGPTTSGVLQQYSPAPQPTPREAAMLDFLAARAVAEAQHVEALFAGQQDRRAGAGWGAAADGWAGQGPGAAAAPGGRGASADEDCWALAGRDREFIALVDRTRAMVMSSGPDIDSPGALAMEQQMRAFAPAVEGPSEPEPSPGGGSSGAGGGRAARQGGCCLRASVLRARVRLSLRVCMCGAILVGRTYMQQVGL